MTDANNYPLAFSNTLSTSPAMANSKHTGKVKPHSLFITYNLMHNHAAKLRSDQF